MHVTTSPSVARCGSGPNNPYPRHIHPTAKSKLRSPTVVRGDDGRERGSRQGLVALPLYLNGSGSLIQ